MIEIVWLLEETVRAIHSRQISEHYGSPGILDEGLLLSALARPQNLAAYEDPPPDLAASYAFGLVRNHPFIEGNKRVSLVVTRIFLLINSCDLRRRRRRSTMRLASGRLSESELSEWIRLRINNRVPEVHLHC